MWDANPHKRIELREHRWACFKCSTTGRAYTGVQALLDQIEHMETVHKLKSGYQAVEDRYQIEKRKEG